MADRTALDQSRDVATLLRGDILAGVFPPGDRLVEINLCDRYGVGRAAIRSALVELTGEGLVDREANRGATVRRISVREAVEITEARAALESLIAAAAAREASDDDRVELNLVEAHMRDAVDRESWLEYSALNALLHRRVREIGRHEVAGDLVAMLRNRSAHHQYRLALMPGRPAESLEQHAAIIRAIVRADDAGAAAAMNAHLLSVVDVLRHWTDGPGR